MTAPSHSQVLELGLHFQHLVCGGGEHLAAPLPQGFARLLRLQELRDAPLEAGQQRVQQGLRPLARGAVGVTQGLDRVAAPLFEDHLGQLHCPFQSVGQHLRYLGQVSRHNCGEQVTGEGHQHALPSRWRDPQLPHGRHHHGPGTSQRGGRQAGAWAGVGAGDLQACCAAGALDRLHAMLPEPEMISEPEAAVRPHRQRLPLPLGHVAP
mmetsp:Transcript_68710/g.201140  ORF Transcript_68710/g.201140 Transcript_68710/m.201140 type:complete len:209 (-) Transcript_68710:1157-1783(-)